MPGQRRKFTTEFKKQMVQLYENGKSRASIVEEYDLTANCEKLLAWRNKCQTYNLDFKRLLRLHIFV